MQKSDREIMEILEAFDLTRCAHSAADLAGCDPKTVSRHVDRRDRGHDPHARVHRPMKIDPYRAKIEELVERSAGRVRADIVHERLAALGFVGTERTTRRAVRLAKTAYRAGRRRTYRPWITEPGMWLQFDWGHGPVIDGRPTLLFCAWLAWSRFRVVIPTWDRTMGSLLACLDATLRLVGGVPTYLLTDNERTVTIERIARIPVRHPEIVAAGRHYGTAILACAPFDPESKGGSESTVKIAKADLVPTEANLLPAYPSFAALAAACVAVCATVNGRVHRETGRRPPDREDVPGRDDEDVEPVADLSRPLAVDREGVGGDVDGQRDQETDDDRDLPALTRARVRRCNRVETGPATFGSGGGRLSTELQARGFVLA